MNYKILVIAFILGVFSLSLNSCTKVIDVDINDADAQYVVEGFVTLGETTHRVSITKSLNIDESVAYPTVDNAIVILTDDLGNSQTMSLVEPGIYEVNSYPVSLDRTYTLQISVDSKVFTASSTMPQDVQLDTLETFPFSFGPTTINAIVPVRLDPEGIENYYQFKLTKNDSVVKGIYIQSDQYNDGNIMMEPIFADGINNGDTVSVEMYCVDKMIYKYFFTLLQNLQGATPANPTSNFTGGCLGYFSVRTKSVKQIVIPG